MMACKLVKDNEPKTIPMCDLPEGELGIIAGGMLFSGQIVQKETGGRFMVLGGNFSDGFDNGCTLPVRVLEEGELIEVKYS
jgi:hypothetical protein